MIVFLATIHGFNT